MLLKNCCTFARFFKRPNKKDENDSIVYCFLLDSIIWHGRYTQ